MLGTVNKEYRPLERSLLRICLVSLFLAACHTKFPSSQHNITLLDVPSRPQQTEIPAMEALNSQTAVGLVEQLVLSVDDVAPVADLIFRPSDGALLAAYAGVGTLRHWDIGSASVTKSLDVGPIGLGGVAFSANGSYIATGAGVDWMMYTSDDDYLGWQVWSTDSGELTKVGGQYYDSKLTRTLVQDIQLTNEGTWALMISASADNRLANMKNLHLMGVTVDVTGDIFVDMSRLPEEDDYDVISFDPNGEFFAAAGELGQVVVFPFDPPSYPRIPELVVNASGLTVGPQPLALAFDPTRHWLAIIRGTDLVVWDLQKHGTPTQLIASVGTESGSIASITFSYDGTLLALGTRSGWQVWDVVTGRKLAEVNGIEVYVTAFSPDGQLVAWGDNQGNIHIWGVPQTYPGGQ